MPEQARGEPERPTRRARSTAFAALAVVVAGLLTTACAPDERSALDGQGTGEVIRIIDGDTIVVALDSHDYTIRLIGIDTPETHHPSRPVECFGPESTARIAELIPPGTAVDLQRDDELWDVYGRILAYVFRSDDGLFVNAVLAAEGYATVLDIAPNTAHRATIGVAVREARRSGLGLWTACIDTP